MTEQDAINFVNSCKWNEAKSYSKTFPHFYTTRKLVNDNQAFEQFLRYLRDKSIIKRFHTKQYLYLELQGFEYWEMGRPIKAVEVLNKAIINDNQTYRIPTPNLCDEVTLKAKLNERDLYLEKLLQLNNPTPIEMEQIKFLLDTERRIYGGGKNIIDHSSQEIKYQ